MSSRYKWDELDPFTRRQIELQPWDTGYGTDPPTLRTCGCEVWGERWHLCQFHEGVEDGASEVRAEVERLTMMHLSAESELVTAQEREKMLRKEVVRLTAELAEARKATTVWAENAGKISVKLTQAEAREKKLRAITGQMLDGKDYKFWSDEEAAGFESACNEWDRRAGEVT